jgi:threonine/homoserine/homoserine lactone efflux protein
LIIQAIGDLLPIAVAVALSPIPIIAVVLILGTPRARSNGPLFAVGWVAGLAAVMVLVVVLLGGAGDVYDQSSTVGGVARIVFGAVLLVMGGRQWTKRTRRGEEPQTPGWMATIDGFTPGRALVLGLALSGANPKNLILIMAAAGTIAAADLGAADTAITVGIFVALGSTTVIGAVVFYLLDADRAARPLAGLKGFMMQHNAVIMMVVLLLIGASVLGEGINGLAS